MCNLYAWPIFRTDYFSKFSVKEETLFKFYKYNVNVEFYFIYFQSYFLNQASHKKL